MDILHHYDGKGIDKDVTRYASHIMVRKLNSKYMKELESDFLIDLSVGHK